MKMPKDKKVYVIGMAGLEEELEEEGVTHIGGTVSMPPTQPCHNLRVHRDAAL